MERTHSKEAAGGLGEVGAGRLVVPHVLVHKLGGITGEQDRPCNPGFQPGEIMPQNL